MMQPLILCGFLIGGVGVRCCSAHPANFFCNGNGLHDMNDNQDLVFQLFREVFSVKTTDIAELMPTKAEQLEEVMR